MLILVRPHVSLLDGPAVARFLPKAGIVQAVFAIWRLCYPMSRAGRIDMKDIECLLHRNTQMTLDPFLA